MNIAAAVFADFRESFLGGPSALLRELHGRLIIDHTLRRAARIDGLQSRLLVIAPADEPLARAALARTGLSDAFSVRPIDNGARPRRALIRCARKWGLDSWRGTPLGTTYFDEFLEPRLAARLHDNENVEALLCIDGCSPALDPAIAARMIEHARENSSEATFVFTQSPPGIAGVLLRRTMTRELIEHDCPLGLVLSYRPEAPAFDLITRSPCLRVAAEIAQTPARLCGDTHDSFARLGAAFAELGEDCGADALCAWLARCNTPDLAPPGAAPPTIPREVELELTTDDLLPESTLRPRGQRVPCRVLGDIAAVGRLAQSLAQRDDRRIVLGGFGDPLMHPRFPEVCAAIRAAGVCALGVTTPLVELSDALLDALIEHRVDAVEVLLDANDPATYRTLHGRDCFAQVVDNIERIQTARRDRKAPAPVLIPSITRCAATRHEVEPFFDRWIRTVGTAVIRGHNDYCGALPADSLLSTTRLVRGPCRRLRERMMLLADGTAVLCSQDVASAAPSGSWLDIEPLAAWRGSALADVRRQHERLDFAKLPACARCQEWDRT